MGVLLQQSNWALLNGKSPDDLRRILGDTYNLPTFEIDQACTLLGSYYVIYRRDRRGSQRPRQFDTHARLSSGRHAMKGALTNLLTDSTQQPVEWALLLVLKLLSDNRPTSSMTLAIDDQTARLAEHRLNAETDHNSIYAQVVGDWHESFQVTLTADTGETISLPPFAFSRGKGQ